MSRARLGSIEFINSLPVDLGLLSGEVVSDLEISQDSPARLNEKLLATELDLSAISAIWYAQHPSQFLLLPDLSISSDSAVESVLLFSKFPLSQLEGRPILITAKGRTTPALLEILCRRLHGFGPVVSTVDQEADAVLVIGDEALHWRQRKSEDWPYVIDLAEEWKVMTGHPFVFAVWAVRRDFFQSNPHDARRGWLSILESKQWGLSHLSEILRKAAQSTGLPEAVLRAYFSRLTYDFGESLQKGLRRFLEEATHFGLLATVPELEFMPSKDFALR